MGEVRTEQRGRVLVATMDNPPHALMDTGIVEGLQAVVERATSDDGIGAVVLTGSRPGRFIAHYDVAGALAGPGAGLFPRALGGGGSPPGGGDRPGGGPGAPRRLAAPRGGGARGAGSRE